MNFIKKILKDDRIAFQVGLISRGLGLFVFSILIAHRWGTEDVSGFESLSILQYLIFFSWLPAWGIVILQVSSKGRISDQKSFLFSNLRLSLLMVTSVFIILLIWHKQLMPWLLFTVSQVSQVLFILIGYSIMQMQVFRFYLLKQTVSQWLFAGIQVTFWVVAAIITDDFAEYFFFMAIISSLYILLELKPMILAPWHIDWSFWYEVVVYGAYLVIGSVTLLFSAYYIQSYYGLGDQFNWYRYGTRELPLLPVLITGFAQSFLVYTQNSPDGFPYDKLKKGLTTQILLIILPLSLLIFFAEDVFGLVYGTHFKYAGVLMSIFLLIYIPRMIPSPMILQSLGQKRVLFTVGLIELGLIVPAVFNLVPRYGLGVAVWVLVAGTLIERVLQMAWLYRHHQIYPGDYIPLRAFAVWVIALVGSYIIQYLS